MLSQIRRWTLGVGYVSFVPFAIPLLSFTQADISIAQAAEPLDINTASADQLKALPDIGDAYCEKTLKSRPYKRKDELVQKKVIPPATYDKIKDQIVVKQE